MRLANRPTIAALLVTALAACASHAPRPAPANVPVYPPIVTFRSATVAGAAFDGITVDVGLDVENPNDYALPVVRLSHAVSVDGVQAWSGNAPASVAVASRGRYPVTVPVFLPYASVPDIGARMASGQPFAYRVSGAVGFQTPAGVMDLPVGWEGTLPVPKPPQFSFEGIDVGALGALALSFDVLLRVQNPNAFPLPPGKLGHRIAVAGAAVGSGERKLPPVGPGSTALVAIPVQINPFGAGAGVVSAVGTALQGAEVPVALEGQATFAGIPIPVHLESRIARKKK